MFASWEGVSSQWLAILVDAAVKGTVVLALAGLLTLGMRRTSAAPRHAVWFMAMVGLLALPILSATLPGWQILPSWCNLNAEAAAEPADNESTRPMRTPVVESASAPPPDIEVAEPIEAETPVRPRNPGLPNPAALGRSASPRTNNVVEPSPTADVSPGPSSSRPLEADAFEPAAASRAPAGWSLRGLAPWLAGIWLIGAAAAMSRLVLASLSLWWLERTARPVTAGPWADLLRQTARDLELRRRVALLMTDRCSVPLAAGILRPRLVLPAGVSSWPADRRRLVMLHELGHVKRWDCLTKVVAQVASALYWFHPLAWLALKWTEIEAERACDDLVLARGACPCDYAEHILQIAARRRGSRLAISGAIAMARPSKLEGRLLAILDTDRRRRSLTRIGAAVIILAIASAAALIACVRAGEGEKHRGAGLKEVAEDTPPEQTDMPAWAKAAAAALPDSEVVQFDRRPSVQVGSHRGFRMLLRKARREYVGPMPPSVAAAAPLSASEPADPSQFRTVYSHVDLVLFPGRKELPADMTGRIPWQDVEQEHFVKAVNMGEGLGFHWFGRTTLYWQEWLREKLDLKGGDDRLKLLAEGLFVEDKGNNTANSVGPLLARAGERAIAYIEAALNEHPNKAPWWAVGVLGKIPGERATRSLQRLYASDDKELAEAAAYALIQQPYRKEARAEYFDLLRQRKYVHYAAAACVEFGWKEVIPMLQEICDKPAYWGDFRAAFEARRTLQGRPVPKQLQQAERHIRRAPFLSPGPAEQDIERAKRLLMESPDKEAATIAAIGLAKFVAMASHDKVQRVQQAGREILRALPAEDVRTQLKTLIDGAGDENDRRPYVELLKWLNAAGPVNPKPLPATFAPDDPRKGAKVELVLNKDEYLLGENILLHHRIVNRGTKPLVVELGGDYRGSPRALRFKVIAIGPDGKQVEDPFPAVTNMGGLGGPRTLQPGDEFWSSLPLMRYCDFAEGGVYRLKVYHDLGWDPNRWERMLINALPKGAHLAPIVETSIKLVMPTEEQARQVVDRMLSLPADPNAVWSQRVADYQDFTALRYPVYLPLMEDLARKGKETGLTALGMMAFPEATQALIGLCDHPDGNIAAKAMDLLIRRLPDPDFARYEHWATEKRLSERSWRDEMRPAVLEKAWTLLARDDRESLIRGARVVKCLGPKDDLPRFLTILDRVMVKMKDDPVEQNAYPRPVHATGNMIRAAWQLVERGAEVPADVETPGRAVLFMLAVGRREEFRPAGWQDRAKDLLRHPVPYVRAVTLENLPKPPPESVHPEIAALLEDGFLAVQVTASNVAGASKSERFQAALLDLLAKTKDQWLLRAAYRTALACGAGRDRVLEICIDRLDEPQPADSRLKFSIFDLMIQVVQNEGGHGYSQVNWESAAQLQAQWRRLLETRRDQIRAGQRFKIAEPPLTPDLFPRGFQLHRKDGSSWPDWSQ